MRSRDTLTYGKVEARAKLGREGFGRRVVAGPHLHAIATARQLERARRRIPGALRRPRSVEHNGVHGPADDAAGDAVGVGDRNTRGGVILHDRSVGRLPRLHDGVDARRGAVARRRRAAFGRGRRRIARLQAPPQNILLTVGASNASLVGRPNRDRDGADQRRLRLDQGLRLGARRAMTWMSRSRATCAANGRRCRLSCGGTRIAASGTSRRLPRPEGRPVCGRRR